MSDNNYLKFDLNKPAEISSVPVNSTDNRFTPSGVTPDSSEQSSGNNKVLNFIKKYLKPAPRSQLNIPTQDIYHGNVNKFYKPVIGNANFVRGNVFAAPYHYSKGVKVYEKIMKPEYQNPLPFNDNIDYNGDNEKIIIRSQSPFYPFPTENYYKNKEYKTYPHINNYMNNEPIYRYPYGKIEGINRGIYNSELLEPFSTPGQMANNSAFLGVIVIVFSLSIILIYYKSK